MITKMKKLTFLIYHKDYECFLQSVRDLGVVHVAEKSAGDSGECRTSREHPFVRPLCFNY